MIDQAETPVRKIGVLYASLALLLALLNGCASAPPRNAVPESLADDALVVGQSPDARWWGDATPPGGTWVDATEEEIEIHGSGIIDRPHNYLALSGGSSNGAFGAGLMVGWSEAGTRPEFQMVTGISAGALIAPFAFLGPDYDDELEAVFTTYGSDDLLSRRGLLAIFGQDALADTAPLRELISRYINEDMMAAIAAEGRRGRQLFAGTVNLDAGRPVIWNLTGIAAQGDLASLELIRDVLLASASIPGVFPPVMIATELNGERYEEMHVDGGAAQQIFLYPLGVDWAANARKLRVEGTPDVWTIRNARLEPRYLAVEQKAIPIATRALGSVMRYQGLGDMYRIYAGSKRDGLNYHLAYIPAEFDQETDEEFDREYMRALFGLARDMARSGYPWKSEPPASIVEVHEVD